MHGSDAAAETSIARYEAGAAQVRESCAGLSEAQLNTRIAPGTWSIQEIVVHLLDSDLIATHRMRRIAAEHLPLLVSYDENAFIANLPADRIDLATAIELFEVHRRYTAQWLRTLPAGSFSREGIHTQRGKITLGQIVDIYSWHVDHHLEFVHGKRAALSAR
jgi:uncharacterized damage-inducible protein DinB